MNANSYISSKLLLNRLAYYDLYGLVVVECTKNISCLSNLIHINVKSKVM